jgi:hypothetical protein
MYNGNKEFRTELMKFNFLLHSTNFESDKVCGVNVIGKECKFIIQQHRVSQKCIHILFTYLLKLRQYSVWLRAVRSGFDPRQGQRIFFLAPESRPALRPTQPPIQWVPGVISPGGKARGRGVTLTTHPHLVPRLSMSRSYTSSPTICLHGM